MKTLVVLENDSEGFFLFHELGVGTMQVHLLLKIVVAGFLSQRLDLLFQLWVLVGIIQGLVLLKLLFQLLLVLLVLFQ